MSFAHGKWCQLRMMISMPHSVSIWASLLSCFAILAYQVIIVQPHYCKGKPRVVLRTHGLCVQRS